MDFPFLKDIVLLISGGVVTFVITIATWKFQRKQPKITWHSLPELSFGKEHKKAISWVVGNSGNKSAKGVRILFRIPDEFEFSSFNAEPSEQALEYTIDEPTPQKRIVSVPLFTHDVSINVSCIVPDNMTHEKIELSIVGEDVLGKEAQPQDKGSALSFVARTIMPIFSIIVFVGLPLYIVGFLLSLTSYSNTRDLARIYLEIGKPAEARRVYADFQDSSFFNTKPLIRYELARIFAIENNAESSIEILVSLKNSGYLNNSILSADPAFDSIRKNKEFIQLVK